MARVTLCLYHSDRKEKAKKLIKNFWRAHNNCEQTDDEALRDLKLWTSEGNSFYFINYDNNTVGFAHLGSRGGEADWLEHLFVEPAYQRQGIATEAIKLIEALVMEYSMSLYIEVAARNIDALKLYYRLGFDTLNTITVRKDFFGDFSEIDKASAAGYLFKIKQLNE